MLKILQPASKILLPAFFLSILLIVFFISQIGWEIYWSANAANYALATLSVVALCAVPTLKIFGGRLSLIGLVVLILLYGVGITESISAAIFCASCISSGILIAKYIIRIKDRISILEAAAWGLGFYLLFFSLFIYTHINNKFTYLAILIAPIFLLLLAHLKNGIFNFKKIINVEAALQKASPFSFVIFLFLIFYMGSHAFLPSSMADDNSVHLGVWTKLAHFGTYQADIVSQIWSVSPSPVQLLHSTISIISESDAKSALNLFIYIFTALLVFSLSRLVNENINFRLVLTSLFLSTPMIANLLGGLQSDLFLGLITIIGCKLLWDFDRKRNIGAALSILIICAICGTTKITGVLISAGLIFTLAYLLMSSKLAARDSIKVIPLAITMLFSIAIFITPYLIAYIKSGNPVFPLYNGIFKSPYFDPVNFLDARFDKGATINSFFGMFFDTPRYFESRNFVAGFQYFLILPIALIACFLTKNSRIFILVIPAFFYALPMFLTLQYVRYFYEVMPLISIIIGVVFNVISEKKVSQLLLGTLGYLYILLNFVFLPEVSWSYFRSPIVYFNQDKKDELLTMSMPEQILNQKINALNKNAKVLYDPSRTTGATLAGSPFYNAWHSPSNVKLISAWDSVDKIKTDVDNLKIDFIYMNVGIESDNSTSLRSLLREYLSNYGYPQLQAGSLVAYKPVMEKIRYDEILDIDAFDSEQLKVFSTQGTPQINAGAILINSTDLATFAFDVAASNAFKYNVTFRCVNDTDKFVALINWDIGPPYYKLISCSSKDFSFVESAIIPLGAKKGLLYLTSRGADNVHVTQVSLGVK